MELNMVSRGRTRGTVGRRSADLLSHKEDEKQEWQSQAQDRGQQAPCAPNFPENGHGNQVENNTIQQR